MLANSLCCQVQLHRNIARGFRVSGSTAVVVGVASTSSIEIHHGGKFVDSGQRVEYLGGIVVEDLHLEVDEWSLQEIVSQLKQQGYKGFARVWYKEPGMDLKSDLREIKSDGNAMRMARSLVSSSCKHCEVYVVNGARESNGIEITSTNADYVPEGGEDSADDDGLLEVEVDAESEPSTEEEVFDDNADDGDHEDHFGFEVEDNDPPSNALGGYTGLLNDEGTAAAGTAEGDEGLREGDEQVGGISDGYEIDDIDSYEGDSDDMIKKRGSLNTMRDIRFQKKNDKVRCRVVCKGRKGKCKWVCFASKVGGSDCFRIKTLNGKHTCGRIYSGRLASSSWISKKIANNISRGEEMNLATVIQTIQDKYMAISVLVRRTGQRGKQEKRYKGGQSNTYKHSCTPSQPPQTPAPPSLPTTLPIPASLPTTLHTPVLLPAAPASQPLPKFKIFGVRRSGRLKIGVRKPTNQPPEHVDLTLD
ncbi:hypothetical protein Ahy_A01g001820 [Arachis hypogaea]|uniref:PB1-like domain-containing protein n=1 Tax=Arachis hypogaea TaxID=3818 RepID=A0A445EPJ0_ARAHY|nr:hypothetical protein Ahy_A01g001820 [Arachis hypogaea]